MRALIGLLLGNNQHTKFEVPIFIDSKDNPQILMGYVTLTTSFRGRWGGLSSAPYVVLRSVALRCVSV